MTAQTGWIAQDLHDQSRWIHYFSATELEAVYEYIAAAPKY